MKITEDRRYAKGMPDLLLYGALVDDGVLLLQDGALLAGWSFAGPDLASATEHEMAVLSSRLSADLRLGSGWMVQCDAIRSKTPEYAGEGAFPDVTTLLIDTERREAFTRAGTHFEGEYFLTLTYLPPVVAEEKVRGYMFEGRDEKQSIGQRAIEHFKNRVAQFEANFGSHFRAKRLRSRRVDGEGGFWCLQDDLLRFVRRCVVGEDFPFVMPEIPAFLHELIGCRDMLGGIEPEIGGLKMRVVAIDGFPHASTPGMLAALDALPFEYRWHTRAILMDPTEATKEIEREYKRWNAKTRGFMDQLLGRVGRVNHFAAEMAADAEAAMSEATKGDVQFAKYTSVIVILDESAEAADDHAKTVVKILQNKGFSGRIETLNALEAWRGSLPGDGYRNVRRVRLHTLNLADCLPISSVWCGAKVNPSALMPRDSPPLMYATSLGATPFRLHLHDSDVGHTVVLGPSGAGKSTLLASLVAQWFRYDRAQVYVFDKGYSMEVLTAAAGGQWYDVAGEGSQLHFCPLSELDTRADQTWAADWIECLCELVGLKITPELRNTIAAAVQQTAESPERTLTEFTINVQSPAIQEALKHYTVAGSLGKLLDASREEQGLQISRFCTIEMQHLMDLGEKAVVPVLLYLFRQIEKRLDGSPTLIVLDEAWTYLQHEMFRERIAAWLRTFRKLNAAVILATQSIADVMNSPIRDVVMESCRTKMLLPNAEAGNESSREFYKQIGLNSREIELIQVARPKEHYYITSPAGRQMVTLSLGLATLAFTGASDAASRAKVRALRKAAPDGWVEEWLRFRNAHRWAQWVANTSKNWRDNQ